MYSSTTQQAIEKSSRLIGVFAMAVAWGVIVVCLFPVSASAQVSISGTLYENDGVTAITSTKTIVAAVATSTVSLYSTTTEVSGAYTITITDNIADGVYLSSTTPVTLFVNDNDTMSPDLASTLTYAISSTTDMTGIDLQAGRVIFNNATGVAEVSLATDSVYDGTDDTDILFTMTSATTSVVGDMLITSGTTLRVADALELSGDFTQQGEFVASTSEVIFSGLTPQIATGTMQGTSQFYDLTITNTSGTGDGTQSVTFGSPVMATGTFSMVADTSAAFTASYAPTDTPHSFNTVNWQGGGNATEIYLRSTDAGFNWYAAIDGAQMIDFVNVQDNFASVASGTVVAQNSTNAGNNTNWVFANEVPYWSQNQWTLYDSITIDAANIDEDLTDFPVYVDLSDLSTQFWNTVTNGGGDIRVTTDSNTEVSREVVSASTTLKTGELHFKAPTISSTTDTTFRIWYNGSSDDYATTSTYGAQAVWSNEYVGVWHLGNEFDTLTTAFESTDAAADGTFSGASYSATAGQIGGGYNNTNNSFEIQISDLSASYSGQTLSLWMNYAEAQVAFPRLVGFDSGGADVEFPAGNFARYRFGNSTDVNSTSTYLVDNKLSKYVISYDLSNVYFYRDGSLIDTQSLSRTADTIVLNTLFNRGDGGASSAVKGTVDEFRLASTSRSAAWIAAEYLNQATTTDFYSINTDEPWSQNQWTLYDSITIDAANIDEDLTDFPVYVDLSDLSTQFWNTVTNGGGDIRVTTDSNTEVSREVVSASTTLKTGELHFKAPTISSTTDTTFRIWYNGSSDDYATTSTYGAQAVWSNEYVYVSHDGGGTDSTANASNGTASGTLTYGDSTGSLGAATSYTGGSYSDLGNGSVLEVTFPFTLQAWVNSSTTAGFTNILSTDEYSNSMYAGAAIRLTNTINAVEAATGDASGNSSSNRRSYTTAASVAVDTWTQVVGVFADFDDRTTYINMSSSTNAVSGTATTLGYSTQPASVGYDFEGSIDEVRIASTSRSAAWIAAEYLNQATTTDFYTRSGGNSLATVTDHEAGQVSNAFGSQDEINKALFAFNLIPESDTATVTALTFDLYGVVGIDSSDFSNIRLYKDYDDDALYDVTDEQVGGVGSMSLGATFGTISFTEDFAATSSRNYVLVADWNEPERGAILNISLSPNKVTMVDAEGSVIVGGLVDNAQHGRISGFGGGSGSSAAIGSAAPAGNGVITGGTNEGGELIGNDPDFYLPTVDSGSWSNGSQTYDGIDGTYASDATGTDHTFSVFTNSIPSTNSIEGIVVKLEVSGTTAAGDIGVELSWDAGSTFTSTGYNTGTLTTTDTIVALGGTSDVWGRAWTPGELSDANFRVRVTGNPSSNTVQIDAIQVKVYHQSSGGSQSGGGAI